MKYKKMILVGGTSLISASTFLAVSLSVNENNQNQTKINSISKIYNKKLNDFDVKKEISLKDPLPFLKIDKSQEGFVKLLNVF